MKKTIVPFILFLGLTLTMTSCGAADDAEKHANKFFKHLIKGNFSKASNFLDPTITSTDGYLDQIMGMAENQQNGKLLSAEKSIGFKTNIENGITKVELPYKLTYEKGINHFQVIIVDRGGGYKIVAIQ